MKVESPKCNGEGPREESRVCPSLMEALNWASRNTSENDSLYDLDSDTPDEAESEKAIAVADQQYENITLEMEPPRAIPVVFKLSPMYRDTPVRTGLLPGESESDVASYSDDEHPVSFINLFKSPFYPYRQHSIAITAADRPYIKDPASVPDEKDRAEWELISAQYQTHEVVVDDGTDLGKVCSPTSLIGDDYECPRVPKLTVKDRFPRSYVNNDPLLLVNPNTLDPLPNCVGNRMKINRSKVNRKNKAYSRIYYVIPDLSVRFSALMASLKVSGFEELRLSSVLNICGNSGKKRPSGACSSASNSDKVNQKTTAALRSLYSQEEISYRHVIRAGMTHEEKIDALSQHARNKLVSTPLWSLRWCKRMKSDEYSIMAPHQKVNHFPATWGIGRKDNLHRHLKAFSDKHGDDNYFFFPQAFLLPQDALILKKDMKLRTHCPPGQSKNVYIVKQVASACGRGMKLLQNSPHLPKGPWVVQRYIHDPYLIAGLKFDLRIYVVVTSFNPLRVYMYEDGLVRFATSPYPTANKECLDDEVDVNSMNSFGDTSADGIPPIPTKRKKGEGKKSNKSPSFKINEISAHLTNYSVNRHADNFIQPECDGTDNNNDDDDDDDDDPDQKGSKWVISTLKRYLENKCNIPFRSYMGEHSRCDYQNFNFRRK